MKRYLHILALLLLGPLIAACSFRSEPTQTNTTPPKPTARRVTTQSGASINGRLLFVQDGNLYLYQDQSARQLTNDGLSRDPAWAPDGQQIAFVRREESFSDIYLLDPDGGLPTQVTFNRGQSDPWTRDFMHEVVWAAGPSWAPDGERLLFLSQVAPPASEPVIEYPLSIYRYRLDLVGTRQPTNDDLLIRSSEADLQRPVWSPDGNAVAYVRVPRDNEPKQIMLFNADTGASVPFPGVPADSYDPAWSPDGRWLAFAAVSNGKHDLWAVPAPTIGGAAVRLTNTGNVRAPAWSPDGTQIAFVQIGQTGTDVYVMPMRQEGVGLSSSASSALTSNGQVDANSGLSWAR